MRRVRTPSSGLIEVFESGSGYAGDYDILAPAKKESSLKYRDLTNRTWKKGIFERKSATCSSFRDWVLLLQGLLRAFNPKASLFYFLFILIQSNLYKGQKFFCLKDIF
jgi:hypothetical protein